MKKAALSGFTLIELLVVIAIMAVIGVFTLANYRSFGEDQDLKSAALDIQSQIRTAQTNASSGVKCENVNTRYGWRNDFYRQSDGYKIRLSCRDYVTFIPRLTKYLVLPANIIIENITVDGQGNSLLYLFDEGSWQGSYAAIVFEPPFAKVSFGCNINYPITGCSGGTQDGRVVILLKNTVTGSTKQLIIEKGGRIYGQ